MDIKKHFDCDLYKSGLIKGFNSEQFKEDPSLNSIKNEPLFYRLGFEKGKKLHKEYKHLELLLKEHYNS